MKLHNNPECAQNIKPDIKAHYWNTSLHQIHLLWVLGSRKGDEGLTPSTGYWIFCQTKIIQQLRRGSGEYSRTTDFWLRLMALILIRMVSCGQLWTHLAIGWLGNRSRPWTLNIFLRVPKEVSVSTNQPQKGDSICVIQDILTIFCFLSHRKVLHKKVHGQAIYKKN